MTLTIKIHDLDNTEAGEIVGMCTEKLQDLNKLRVARKYNTNPMDQAWIEFSYEQDPAPVFRGEETTFSRYLNSTTKE